MGSMNTANVNLDRKMVFPFYIFLTLLFGYIGFLSIQSLIQAGASNFVLPLSALFLIHVGLYWLNVFWKNRNTSWWFFYYPAQTLTMLAIVFILQGRSTIGLSFLFSATISMTGEALGVWGNTRRALFISLFYIGLLLSFLYLFSERALLLDSLTALLVNGGSIILFMFMFNQQFIQRQKAIELAESLESANAKLAAYNAKIESLTLQNERQRMARELHDTLAQGVAGLVLQLEAVKAHLSSDRKERASAIVEQTLLRARSTLAESRAAIDDLRSAPTNLFEAIQEKVNRFTQSKGIACETEISINENNLSNEITDHAVGIINEALANVARHAQAKNVKVRFFIQKEKLQLEVQDDGKGFDVNEESNSGHYGLLGMRERARLTNGNIEIESNQNGTKIHFSVEGGK
jgi:NarL family two-component system sensor histidine kinase YdfH